MIESESRIVNLEGKSAKTRSCKILVILVVET